jgi:hypothetical protein
MTTKKTRLKWFIDMVNKALNVDPSLGIF